MTSTNRTPEPSGGLRIISWLTALIGLLAVISAVILALAGNGEAAAAIGVTGAAMLGGSQVTVHIHQ